MGDVLLGNPFRRFLWVPTVLREWPDNSSAGAMDWIETPSSHLLKFNVPGYGKEEIKIQLEEDNVLSIRGEGSSKKEEAMKDSVWHVSERGKGEFSRQVVLPDNVRADQIRAQVEHGVLTVLVPKEAERAKAKTRSIPVLSKL
ncbi:hypothetical protein LUZ60_000231 [Juncus effusus]|nr:hypothetical protein LUZ60_000231 [Juncus effusus]